MTKSYGEPCPTDFQPATRLTLYDGPLELGWLHAGATADFIGSFFAELGARAGLDGNDARHGISYLVNELVENAVKFRAPDGGEVMLAARLDGANFELLLSNIAVAETAGRFGAILDEIVSRDPGELLIERIEANAADDSSTGSSLGILTLMSDYGVRMNWTFEPHAKGTLVRVETYAALPLAEKRP
jgi:hypothetical protein